ncbi:MAG TPA: hypothetical protein VHU89_12200 [Acidobacteriaceae bacterium]|nr:hypothetical protein [Acidobacteriaceae bacterium]
MKFTLPALALFAAASLTAFAASPTPSPKAGSARVAQNCATVADAENLCTWDAPAGTRGRKCVIDVEKMSRKHACRYDLSSSVDMSDHKPMCISAGLAEHIVFRSSNGRMYRVRRLVPVNKTNGQGQACPAHPFRHEFHEEDFNFGSSFDTQEAKAGAIGCFYKLEVQFMTVDPNSPLATHDAQHRHLECRDPHLGIGK